MLTPSGQSLRRAQTLQHMGMVSWIRREVLQQEALLQNLADKVEPASAKPAAAYGHEQRAALTKSPPRVLVEPPKNPPLAPLVVAEDWQGLTAQAASCLRCELAKTRRQSVFSGQPLVTTPATGLRCLVIAESPSENDELEGRLLSDQHGQLLSAMLSSIGWGDAGRSVWTSLVKCRPQGIAVTSAQQISACSPYLLAQIQQLKPKVIITLGTLAAQSLLETSASLAELSSKVHFYRDYPVVTLAHPAYLQRHPQAKAAAWQALVRAKALVI